MARKALVLVLLTVMALGGCSYFKGDKEAKQAEAKMAALRARTDSLRKARRLADSLAQVRYTVCADSVRGVMTKPVAAKSKRKKKKQAAPSEQMIVSQAQKVCAQDGMVPPATVATAGPTAEKPAAGDTGKRATPATAPATVPAEATAPGAVAQDSTLMTSGHDAAWADSVRRAKEMEMSRETFAYSGSARDPFNSLLNMAKAGPEVADLQLVGIYQNLRSPRASVAVFREKEGGKRHKLRAGDQLGRSRLIQIREREVVFTIEDFGFERQETLSLRKQEDVTP
jgi:hypothetical protein